MAIYFATSNKHKFIEAQEILGRVGVSIEQFQFEHNEIRSDSIEEIALEAVESAYQQVQKPVFVDDTGLFIDALKGFPGTYSGWVIKKIGVGGVLKLMEKIEKRNAVFRTCIAYMDENGSKNFVGENSGQISTEPKGKSGFGYDSVFVPEGYAETFAQNIELKNKLSHRYKSLLLLATYLKGNKS